MSRYKYLRSTSKMYKKFVVIKSFIVAFLPAIAWATFIFILSSQQQLPSPSSTLYNYLFKKAAHITVYFVLSWLIDRGLSQTTTLSKHTRFRATFMVCLFYAISDEVHQSYIPGRTASLFDIGFDTIGIIFGVFARTKFVNNTKKV